MSTDPKIVLGWQEYISLPEWDIHNLVCKLDTGALGSALDVSWMEQLDDENLRFELRLHRKKPEKNKVIEARINRTAKVRSSNGETQKRFTVITEVCIGNVCKPIEFSMVNRKKMLRRVLIGRRALAGDFLIDVSEKFLHTEVNK